MTTPKMTDSLKILLSFVLIVVTNILGHYLPPTSIMLSPVTIGLVTGLLITLDFKLLYRILLTALTIMLNDIFIRDFAGGTNDLEGAGYINAFLILGLIISVVIIAVKTWISEDLKTLYKISLILLFPIIMLSYLQYFSLYGLSFSKRMSTTKQEAIENRTFLSDLDFSTREIIYDTDSISIVSGWTEKELVINHTSLISKTEETENINYKIKIKHNFDPYVFSVYYKVNSDDVNGSRPLDSILEFTANKSDNITLTIFKLRDGSVNKDTIIRKVTLKRT